MKYRADFYIPENIIGYTGNINSNPTVYFQRGSEIGHITQDHDIKYNIGREEVTVATNYSIGNDGNGRSVEKDGMRVLHESRSPFVGSGAINFAAKYKLSLAIVNHTQKKQLGDLPDIEKHIIYEYSDTITGAHRTWIKQLKAQGKI